MTYADVSIRVPSEMAPYLRPSTPEEERTRNALLLYPAVQDRTISHGRAAEILGMPKWDLIELYNSFGLAYLDMDISEIEADLANWEALKAAESQAPLPN